MPVRTPSRSLRARLAWALLASTALVGVGPALAQSALPTGGHVVSGGVSIGTPTNGALAITQSSQSAIVNWQGFSIGQNNRVDIAQPDSQSAILNRVTGDTRSTIAGQLNANGQVYLVNPNGISITRTGQVNAGGGFVASSLDIGDEDFKAGRRQFRGSGASAKVSNDGTMTIGRGGYAALIGGEVSNSGTISVPMGRVGLGSGEQATLDLSGDGFLQVAVPTNSAGTRALVRSSGTISADSGSVILSAAAARDMARQAVNLSGTIEARSVSGKNGSITLSGGDGAVAVSGRLDASSAAGKGGSVTVTGRDIGLSHARIDVSGRTGGGTVRIGGGRQGAGPLLHAANLRVDAATTIRADATHSGTGGDVVLWSDVATRFAGTISAKGGAKGGDGGQAEVSSKGLLDYSGTTVLTAANGRFGTLLLDPYNVTISNGTDGNQSGFTATGNDSVINVATLQNALASANVTVSTGSSGTQDGNITVAAPVAWSAPTTLTLSAANAITINGTLSVQGAGGVALNYNTASPTNLSFGSGASVDYGATNNGGTLSINNQNYALVYSMAGLAGISRSGWSALATDLTSTTTYTGSSVAAPGGIYGGTFEGLGHTISNLTIANTDTGRYVGLFGYATGTIRDIGLVGGSISGGNQSVIGALVGQLGPSSSSASVVNAWSTASVTGGDAATVGGLIGEVYASGGTTLVANAYSTGNVTTGTTTGQAAFAGGLVGYQTAPGGNATISGSYATGNVTGGSGATLGGLVGYNDSGSSGGTPWTAAIVNSYATGNVGPSSSGVVTNAVGGLVGSNTTNAGISAISGSFATGAVSNGGVGNMGGNAAGGLVGANTGGGTNGVASITDSFATGAVTGRSAAYVGGLVGWNLGNGSGAVASIATSYATGRVTTAGYGATGGLVGRNQNVGGSSTSIISSYWDISTSGIPTMGIGNDTNGQAANVSGLTTAQFQSGSLPAGFSSSVWATGAGLYPYQTAIFANGVQAVSGFVYSDVGATALSSGTGGAVTVNLLANGATFGSATTGANGYYYAFGTPIAANQSVLAYTGANAQTGATNAATLASASGAAAQGGVNLYGNMLAAPTSALTLSTVPDLTIAANAAAGNNGAALAAIAGTSGRYYIATGSSFTIDGPGVTTSGVFGVQTTASGAGITVAAPITINSGGSLMLNAAGALAFNAPVTANGAAAALAYDQNTTTPAAADLSFAIGAPLSFTGGGNSLAINGNPYTLVYDATGLQNINNGLTGRYALASNIDASGVSGFVPLGTNGSVATDGSNVLNGGKGFTGTFTGLGHTVDRLSVQAPQTRYVGLFGYVGAGGLVQNVGVTDADIHGGATLGAIAGYNAGTVTQSYATGQVFTTQYGWETGGLIGQNAGLLSNSFSTVTVNARDTAAGGGAVGYNNFGTIDSVYAMGAVDIGSGQSDAGGLVGSNYGSHLAPGSGQVTNSFATGAVSGGVNVGSFIGNNLSDNPVSGAYDSTTGRAYGTSQSGSPGVGGGTTSGGSVSVVGLSTSDFQNGGAGGLSAAYGGGTGGLYPYLKSFYPNGVQAISGIAYRDGATDVLSSGVGRPYNVPDAGLVTVMGNGATLATVSTGANGYYYVALPGGTLAASASVLAYTVANTSSGATNAATVTAWGGGSAQAGINIYGGTLSGTVGDITLSAASTSLVSAANAAAGSNSAALGAISNATGRDFIATGASFTIDQAVSTTGLFGVQTTATNAPITVSQAITVNNADSLWLQASGALAIDAPVSVTGAGSVTLAASLDTTTATGLSLLNLSFGPGASIDYGAKNNGGTLTINGQGYGLLYSMSDVANVNGGLAGRYALATDLDATANSYTGAVIAPGTAYNAPAFSGTLDGLGNAITNLSIANTADQVSVGLVGLNTGTIRDLNLVGGSVATTGVGNATGALVGLNQGVVANVSSSAAVSGGARADYIGGLLGLSDGSSRNVAIVNAAATGAVSIVSGNAGGLVGLQQGRNGYTATIANSFATGAVSAAYGNDAGGLVGISQAVDGGTAAITNSYATGMVAIGGQTSVAGGLVGQNTAVRGGAVASLTNVYATGVVSVSGAQATAGGLVGNNSIFDNNTTPAPVTPIVNAYWDTQTSGRSNAIGSDHANQAGNVLGLTTRQLQGLDAIPSLGRAFSLTTDLGDGKISAFAGDPGGLYPYLSSFFPSGVQVISGYAYADAGLTAATPRTIGVVGGGTPFASASSGANGYYYAFAANGTIAGNATLLVTNGANAATLTSANGARIQSVNLYGNALTVDTMATSLSAAPTLAAAQANALTAAGGNMAATTAINTASGRGFMAGGAGFTIDQAVGGPNTFYLQTTAPNAPITVSQPITIGSGGGGVALLASGALTVNAAVTIDGAGTANLAYDQNTKTPAVTDLTFAQGAPLTFANADGSAATGAVGGQALAVNGQSYTLLYSMSDVANVNTLGLAGNYALATDIDAGGTTYTTGVIAGGDTSGGRPTAFSGTFEGLGHTVSNLTIDAPSNSYVGLIGYATGAIRDIGIVGGRVTAFSNAGGLVGSSAIGSVTNAYATGTVGGGDGSFNLGGLVGNLSRGSLTNAYATGAVGGGDNSYDLGGLVGLSDSGSVTNAYATGAVSGGKTSAALGGLVGFSDSGSVTNAYATGAVSGGSGSSNLGGLVGGRHDVSPVTNGYWDTQTSGQSVSAGGGTGLTTRQLQGLDPISGSVATNDAVFFSTATNLGDGTNSAFSGGGSGLYPYLSSFFPNGVQAVSGTVYADAGVTPLASGANGAVTVGVIGNNAALGHATAGANGYYYVFGAAGALSQGQSILSYTDADGTTGARNAATMTSATGVANETGVDIYGNALTVSTTANTLSAAPSLAAVKSSATGAAGGNADALAAITGAQGRSFIATNGDFAIDEAVTTGDTFRVQTTAANAAITASNAITITDGGSLGLLASGALTVNAPITARGAVSVALAYDQNTATPAVTDLAFAQGAPLTFIDAQGNPLAGAPNSGAGSLAINAAPYTLLYSMGDVEAVNNLGVAGNYAVATEIDASGTTYTTGVIAGGDATSNQPAAFTGTFEGLGHTISNLTISGGGNSYVGLFGASAGTLRDIGLVGGSVAGGTYVGALVGLNAGTITQAYATGVVSGSRSIGGLVGLNAGTITQAYATGAVSGKQSVGGLAGRNGGTITQAYATGGVSGGDGSGLLSGQGGLLGGFVGYNTGTITQAYATGAVSGVQGSTLVAGFAGFNDQSGAITQAYWDTQTSGRATGIGQDDSGQGVVTGLTTRQLQGLDPMSGSPFSVVSALGDGTTSAFAGGASGLYPYLSSFAPNGVQAFSGTAYGDAGLTPLASNAGGAVTIGLLADGVRLGNASAGANGYYYVAVPLGAPLTPAVNNGQKLLAYTAGSAPAAATLATASGGRLQTGLDLYGNALTVETAATRFSQGPRTAGEARTLDATALAAAAGASKEAQAAILNAVGLGLRPTGAGFSIDQTPTIDGVLAVQACACAPITVDAPVTVADGQSLGLLSGGALTVNAPIIVNGAASLALAYDSSSPANLTLRAGTTISFDDAFGNATGNAVSGQALAINGQRYTLLYSMADLEGMAGNTAAGGTGGLYALATGLTATASYTDALVSPSAGSFYGVLEGFNHGITGLTIDKTKNGNYAGLVGQNSGTIRDIALVGGSITGDTYVGALAGENFGTVFNVSSSADVTGQTYVGGLVGANDAQGVVANASATGAVAALPPASTYAGGLVGSNQGLVTQSYATGPVSGASFVGGLIGGSDGGTINRSFAMGPVSGQFFVGGLIGASATDTISQVYATGAVVSTGPGLGRGGLIGSSAIGSTVTAAYWNTETSGQSTATDGGTLAGATGLTTAQFQSGSLPNGFDGTAWATGSGLYPYLTSLFPDGVRAVSGTAYTDSGKTPLASTTNGLGIVSIASGGSILGSVATGANGYYYYLAPAGTLANGHGVAAYTVANANTGAADAMSYASGVPATVTKLDISGGWRRDTTALTSLTALDAGFTATVAGTPAASLTLGSRAIDAAGAFAVDTALSVSDTLTLDAAGAVTQSGLVTAPKLRVSGAVTLTLPNRIGTVAANAASLDLAGAGALTIGSVAGADGTTTSGLTSAGALRVSAGGTLTIASGAPVSGASPVLATTGAFVNDAGASAVTATSGRWLVYSADPAADTFGGLDSGNTAIWNTGAASSVSLAGNRYVFARQQTLTVTSTDAAKTYGQDATGAIAGNYGVGGYAPGVAGAYLGDSAATAFSGSPLVTSAGAAATASVAGSPYRIALAQGTLASSSGYGFTFADLGSLTVTPRPITLTADARSRLYGDANPALTYTVDGAGLVNGDILSGGLATSATPASDVGSYAITQGSLAASADYTVTYLGANLTVTPRPGDATGLASTVTRRLDENGFLPAGLGGLSATDPGAPAAATPAPGFVGLTDPRFQGIVVCTGGAAGGCYAAPVPPAPRPQASR